MSDKVSYDRVANPPKQGKSCWFYGCISLAVIGVIGIAMMVGGAFWLKGQVEKIALEYTGESPNKLPEVTYTDEQMASLEERSTKFQQSTTNKGPAVNLELTGDEINALIAKHMALPNGDSPGYVELDGDKIKAQISVPLDQVAETIPGMGALKGRYLNGTGSVKIVVQDGYFAAFIQDLEVNGQQVPEQFMTQVRNQNIFKDAQNDPQMRKNVESFEKVEVKDGKLIVTPKS